MTPCLGIEILSEGVAILQRLRTLSGRARIDAIHEPFDVWAFLPAILAEDSGQRARPSPNRHVDDRVGFPNHKFTLGQSFIDDPPVPVGLIDIALKRVLFGLGRKISEVEALSGIRANASRNEH